MEKPKIRFKGYQEDWEQRKVTELLKNSLSAMKIGPFGSALKKEYFVEEGIKVYAQENAFTGDFSMGDYYITEDKYKELKSCELYPGDLVISMMGTIGACAIFPKNAEKGIMNSHLLRLQFNNEVIPEYIMYLLRDSVLIRKQIDRLSVGSIMSGLSSSVVKKLVFPIPKLAEQKRIVEYLDSIDRLITLHQRKCEEMKTLKKYMLQKMFPQNGQLVPQIRFSGFTEDWEQRKVSELCSISTGKSNTQDKVEDGEYPFYVRSPIIERSTKYLYDEEAVITVGDGVGTGKVFHYVNGKYDLHQRCYRMYGFSDELNAHYFYHTFSKLFYKRVMAMTAKTSVDSVRLEMISDMKIPVPNVEEQRKIGNLLDGIDHLITLHQQKCDELRNIKKFMLQNMFI